MAADAPAAGAPGAGMSGGRGADRRAGLRRTTFPAWYDFAALLLLFVASQAVMGAVAAACGLTPQLLAAMNGGGDMAAVDAAQRTAARATAAGYLAGMSSMTAAALVYRRMRGGRGRAAGLSYRGFDPALLLGSIAVVLALQVVLEPLLVLLPGMPDYDFLGRGGWALLSTVIFAPLLEEFLFRGVIFESVRAKRGVAAAWCISSLCFGVAHGMPAQMVGTAAIGFVLGYACIRSGSIFAGVVIHAVNNALAMLLLMLGLGDRTLSEILPPNVHAAVYAVSALAVAVWLWRACRYVRSVRRTEKTARTEQ